MKIKLSILAILFISNCSCYNSYCYAATTADDSVYEGMSLYDFKKGVVKKSSLESMESGYKVFKMNDVDFMTGRKN